MNKPREFWLLKNPLNDNYFVNTETYPGKFAHQHIHVREVLPDEVNELEGLKAKLPPQLEKLRGDKAAKYKADAFGNNPNGYTVAPGLNEPDVDFEMGWNACYEAMVSQANAEFDVQAFDAEMDRLYSPGNVYWDGQEFAKYFARWMHEQCWAKIHARLVCPACGEECDFKGKRLMAHDISILEKEIERLKEFERMYKELCK